MACCVPWLMGERIVSPRGYHRDSKGHVRLSLHASNNEHCDMVEKQPPMPVNTLKIFKVQKVKTAPTPVES